MQQAIEPIEYEQAVVALMRGLPLERKAQIYDFARFLRSQSETPTPEPVLLFGEPLTAEGALMLASIESLRSYWDTSEEDEAWAHLQEGT